MIASLFKRSSGYLSGLALSRVVTTLTYILLARYFAPHIFGQLVLYGTLLTVVTYFADLGLVQWYQKQAGDNHDKKKTFQRIFSARLYSLGLSIVVTLVFFVLFPSFEPLIQLFFLLNIIPEAFASIVGGYYLVEKKPYKISIKLGVRALFLLGAYVLFGSQFTFTQAVAAVLVGSIVTFVWIFPWGMLHGYKQDTIRAALGVLKESSAYALLTITSFAYARGDQLIIRYLLNPAALGYYGGAYRYLESLSLIPAALSQNLFPLSARKKGIELTQLMSITMIMTGVGFLFGSLMYAISDFLIVGLLGPSYAPAIIVTQILACVLILFFINAPLATVVQSSTLVKKFLPFGILNTVINIVMNILVVPQYGISGAAFVMLFTECTGLIINLGFVYLIYKQKS